MPGREGNKTKPYLREIFKLCQMHSFLLFLFSFPSLRRKSIPVFWWKRYNIEPQTGPQIISTPEDCLSGSRANTVPRTPFSWGISFDPRWVHHSNPNECLSAAERLPTNVCFWVKIGTNEEYSFLRYPPKKPTAILNLDWNGAHLFSVQKLKKKKKKSRSQGRWKKASKSNLT